MLQNLVLDGRLVKYSLLKLFDAILNYADNQTVLTLASTFRTFEWAKSYEPVELTFSTIQQILYPEAPAYQQA